MTKSRGFSARRKEFTESVIAKAHIGRTNFRTGLESVKRSNETKEALMNKPKEHSLPLRNAGEWYSDALAVDDGDHQLYDEDVYDFNVDFSDVDAFKPRTDMIVSLLEVARPARRKGVAKDFKLVKKSTEVTFLGDDDFEIWEDDEFEKCEVWEDDWEKIYDEQRIDTRRSYSSVLRGNEK